MKVPFLDLKANYEPLKSQILSGINEVLDSTGYILGPKVKQFEDSFAAAHEVKHCVGLSTGTDANHAALWALGIMPGGEVILPANTFIATAWGVTLCGGTPVFVDCTPDTYNIDPQKVREAITSNTKAIVAVHLYGQPANMDALRAIADEHDLYLLEDAAQAHLAEYKGRKIGGLSDIASFSFYPGKNLGTYGEGGAITTNHDELARKIRAFRDQGQVGKYNHEFYGHNYRMEAIQGAVLNVKLPYLAAWTEKRRLVAAAYKAKLTNLESIQLPAEAAYAKHVWHLFVVQADDREALQKYLLEKGIATGLHYPVPLHLQKCFSHLGYKRGDFPETERLADHCLSLPLYPEMTQDQLAYFAEAVYSFHTVEAYHEDQTPAGSPSDSGLRKDRRTPCRTYC
jgi:dTDP-4-amino-4,6-dideoxygalactose transaminase